MSNTEAIVFVISDGWLCRVEERDRIADAVIL